MKDTTDILATEHITLVEEAFLQPRLGRNGFAVLDKNGAPVVDAMTFRKDELVFSGLADRSLDQDSGILGGTYLFGGDCWPHFGHFLFESLARLWALDRIPVALDGIVFFAPRTGRASIGTKLPSPQPLPPDGMRGEILRSLGIDVPVLLVHEPLTIERLYVPRQASGMGALAVGTPSHRRFLRDRLQRIKPRDGLDRVYLSRSGYRLRRGGIFGEEHLESNLKAQGYTIYHPEQHTFEHQVSTYLGARQIVGPDSSALHLFGFAGRPEQDLAIVLRRVDGAKDLEPQITAYTGRPPLIVDCIDKIYSTTDRLGRPWDQFAALDFSKLGAVLHEHGFIDDPGIWLSMPVRRHERTRQRYERRRGCQFTEHDPAR